MDDDLPLPLPDRRKNKNKEYSLIPPKIKIPENDKFLYNNITINSNNNENSQCESYRTTTMSTIKLKQIEDMRQKILNYRLLTEKSLFISSFPSKEKIKKCNIILFGPSGSGKSSFIKSLYRSLYNSSILPSEIMNKLIIKSNYKNEGTMVFTQLNLVKENLRNSGIMLCDTRGHIKMNENEKEQFKILLEGNIKDGAKIEQRTERDPFSLWEFWKKSSELFPKEIFNSNEIGINSIPHVVIFVFDGCSDEVIQKEDEKFYKDLVNLSKNKGYQEIHIVLTRIDLFEKMIFERYENLPFYEKNIKLNAMKDIKIEKVINILNVNRSNIHFIENYHEESGINNSLEIDYHILKTMMDVLNSSEIFMLYYMSQNETCFAGCF